MEFFSKPPKLYPVKSVTTASQQNNPSWPSHQNHHAARQQHHLIPDFPLYDETPNRPVSHPQPHPPVQAFPAQRQLPNQIALNRRPSAPPRFHSIGVPGTFVNHHRRQPHQLSGIVHPATQMDELDYSSFLTNNNLGQALGGATDASLFVSPDQLNVSYGDFSLGLDDHSPPSGATGWESTPESALLSSFNTPLNINEHLAGQSVDWSNTPLFQTLSTDADFSAPVASRTSSSSSLPSGAVNPEGVSGHRRTSSNARRLIERSAAVTKDRKSVV